jgi:hypothetical protein
MPKAPILDRECFYEILRDGTTRDLDWNLVNTSLGAMLEARTLVTIGGPVQQWDPYDMSVNRRTPMSTEMFASLMQGSGGDLWPRTFNTQ